MMKEQVGEYVRTLLTDGLSESCTVESLIDDLDERIDVEGVESDREERKLETLRAFMRTIWQARQQPQPFE